MHSFHPNGVLLIKLSQSTVVSSTIHRFKGQVHKNALFLKHWELQYVSKIFGLFMLVIRTASGHQIPNIILSGFHIHCSFLRLKIQSASKENLSWKLDLPHQCLLSNQPPPPSSCYQTRPRCIHSPFPQHSQHSERIYISRVCVRDF